MAGNNPWHERSGNYRYGNLPSGNQAFMIMDTVADFDHDKAMADLALKPRQSEWEAHMVQFQDSNAEASASQKWQLMERVYKMDSE